MALSDIQQFINRAISGNPQTFWWPNKILGPGAVVSDWQRVSNYSRFQNIYFGRFAQAFPYNSAFTKDGNWTLGTNANLSARCVDALHAAVWRDTPCAAPRDEPLISDFANELLENSRISQSIADSVRDTILYGDGVLKVGIESNKLRIRNIHPANYFPELHEPNPQEPTAHNIVWAEDQENGWFRRERYWLNPDTGTYWLTINRFNAHSGQEGQKLDEYDLRVTNSPIIHTYGNRTSGIFWGKSPMSDAEMSIGEYSATMLKVARITELASTKALLAAPANAFDETGKLAWDTNRPYMIEDQDLANFDKTKLGWLDPPGSTLIEPNLAVLDRLEKDVFNTFGLTRIIYGDTEGTRDVGEPGLERLNLMMEFTVKRYQHNYGMFLTDTMNVAAEFGRLWLNLNLPEGNTDLEWTWPDFSPQSDLEKAQAIAAKLPLGLSKTQALRELGYENPEEIVNEANQEAAGAVIMPHSPYVGLDPDLEEQIDAALAD